MRTILPLAVCFLCGCTSLADRFERGNAAVSTPDGLAWLVRATPPLHQAMDACIPIAARPPSRRLVIVADVAADGSARSVRIEPRSEGTRCMAQWLEQHRLPPPPVAAGATFPLGLRVDLE